ncbi:Abi family protein [Fructobacillus fructosus]|uniref:Abi family protein n=1 Tax=Fructobacillus fructosus TaxID=1631 RepID=UPI0016589736|nr:Abi family protein [Fructobacillus fructosus]MBC9119392.1 Abi family protein [Fructobacillus fructosus]MBD9366851.1 Abi family protein [Leuconostoc mesenteroides]
MESKPFKTHNQQLKILRDRGLEVKSSAKRSLEQYGYYSLINGYKWNFLKRDSNGNIMRPEKFKVGSNFQEIQDLYDFDRELRSILFESILRYESTLRATIAYRFSEKYPENHSYLAMDNFGNQEHPETVLKTINELSRVIRDKVNERRRNGRSSNAIQHYVWKHKHVPLWVLVNYLTFGAINYLYINLENDLKIKIASDFQKNRKRSYGPCRSITPDVMESVNHIVNIFRNAVAHGEITFSKRLYSSNRNSNIVNVLGDTRINTNSQGGVFELLLALKLVLTKQDYKKLTKRIKKLIDDYSGKFYSVNFNEILQDMNFPDDFISLL